MRHFIFPFIFLFSFSLVFAFPALAQGDPQFQAPDTLEGAKEGVLNIGDKIAGAIPRAIARIWNNEVLPAWKAMAKWTKAEVWEKRVLPAFQIITDRVKELFGQEIQKRKPIIEQELEKEKQELKTEIKQQGENAAKSLWERFRALLRKE